MAYDPYIVIGTGRSGTSTVARIFHEKLDVFMGYEFKQADSANQDGYWEDVDFHNANRGFLIGKMTYPQWIDAIFGVVAERRIKGIPWGFKDPDASHFLGLYMSFFQTPRIIRCTRKKELVVKSLMTKLGHTRKHAENVWEMKEMILDNLLNGKDCLTIRFDENRLTDETIMKLITEKWHGIHH
jgi:hypothetical protein